MAVAELEHAQEIISELIDIVCKSLKPVFNIAEIEGDAIFAYTLEEKFSRGETLLELIELTYYNFTFQKNIMQEKSSCTCNACQSIRKVDLKFINHFGSFALQNYSGNLKPLGSDVNLIHRLLKNSVKPRSYVLFTENCMKKTELPSEAFIPKTENYEHFGEVETYVTDLSESYKRISEIKRIIVNEEDADYVAKYKFKLPAAILWEWFIDIAKRELWMKEKIWKKGERPKGRTSIGATNHCVHGNGASTEVIVDWRPFEYYTYKMVAKPFLIISTLRFIENEEGTEFHEIIKLNNKWPKFLKKLIVKFIALKVMKVYEGYKKIEMLSKRQLVIAESGLPEKTIV
ncbi:MAG: DUF2652 domain-containing protein [Nitrososphaerales archaeon]